MHDVLCCFTFVLLKLLTCLSYKTTDWQWFDQHCYHSGGCHGDSSDECHCRCLAGQEVRLRRTVSFSHLVTHDLSIVRIPPVVPLTDGAMFSHQVPCAPILCHEGTSGSKQNRGSG